MKVVTKLSDMKLIRRNLKGPVGLVPTMGFLHRGHLALVNRAREENASLVVSIFVNPTQFGPGEDFNGYPRDLERDLAMLEEAKSDIVFMPPPQEIYPAGFNTWICVENITARLEGTSRPGHFRGVTTVVNKLFNIVQPNRAYFGQKDAQQIIVIEKMVADLNINMEIATVATVRESDGLALSSRNVYLNPEERKAATVLYRALALAEKMWRSGEKDAGCIRREMTALLNKESGVSIDYVSIANAGTLDELDTVRSPALVSLSVRIGATRLIDNIVL